MPVPETPLMSLAAVALAVVIPLFSFPGDAGAGRRSTTSVDMGASGPLLIIQGGGACVCNAKLTPWANTPGANGNLHCTIMGLPQPCFGAVAPAFDDQQDEHGHCVFPADPPAPARGPKKVCMWAARKVTVLAAACATQATCGTAPFQLHDQNGHAVLSTFTANESRETVVSIGNQDCGTTPPRIDIDVTDSAGVIVFRYSIQVECEQCPRAAM